MSPEKQEQQQQQQTSKRRTTTSTGTDALGKNTSLLPHQQYLSRRRKQRTNHYHICGFQLGAFLIWVIASTVAMVAIQRFTATQQTFRKTTDVPRGRISKKYSDNNNKNNVERRALKKYTLPKGKQQQPLRQPPYSQFPMLHNILQRGQQDGVEFVLLYFAASWCPMSTKPTKLLARLFPPKTLWSTTRRNGGNVALVFISSDTNQAAMDAYVPNRNWITIPHENAERTAIQIHFQTCAKREMALLGIVKRRHEIPTLLVLDVKKRTLVSETGLDDLHRITKRRKILRSNENGAAAVVQFWKQKRTETITIV